MKGNAPCQRGFEIWSSLDLWRSWSLYLKNHELFHGHLGNNTVIICSAFENSIIWQKRNPLATICLKTDFRGVVLACMLGLFLCSWEKRFHYGDFSNVLYMSWRKTRIRKPYNVKILFPFFLLVLGWNEESHPQQCLKCWMFLCVSLVFPNINRESLTVDLWNRCGRGGHRKSIGRLIQGHTTSQWKSWDLNQVPESFLCI